MSLAVVDRMSTIDVVVVGDLVLDRWLYGDADRLSREGPVPVVDVRRQVDAPGGAANVAANAAALGARVRLLGVVGDDRAGNDLLAVLADSGVDTSEVVIDRPGRTAEATRVVVGHTVVARFDAARRHRWSPTARDTLLARLSRLAPVADCLIVADYGGRVLDEKAVAALASLRRGLDATVVLDAHDLARWRGLRPTAAAPSRSEALGLLPPHEWDEDWCALAEHSDELLDASGTEVLVTTLDEAGALLHRRGERPFRTRPRHPADGVDTCGAGDTFTATFAVALASHGTAEEAAVLAQTAADVVVGQPGTARCERAALVHRLTADGGAVPSAVLRSVVARERAHGRRVVFTNGCFDVLHTGHVQYLREARQLGDFLVVAVNSDSSVARLKGPERPWVPEAERARLLAALDCVDAVTIFEDDSPTALIELLEPDLYVKGGDYTPTMLSETAVVERHGGRVVTVGYVEGRSTTALLDGIRTGSSPFRSRP